MDRGTWWATVRGISQESDMTEQLTLSLYFHIHVHTYIIYLYFRSFKNSKNSIFIVCFNQGLNSSLIEWLCLRIYPEIAGKLLVKVSSEDSAWGGICLQTNSCAVWQCSVPCGLIDWIFSFSLTLGQSPPSVPCQGQLFREQIRTWQLTS